MNAFSESIDNGSKRWLMVLGVAVSASIIYLAYAFVKTLLPTEPSVVLSQKPSPAPAEQAVTRSEPDWNSAQEVQRAQAAATRTDPFAAQYAAAAKAAAKNDPVAAQQAVHREAEYLRTLISQGKLPGAYGNLTIEQVDQMEKNGVMIN
jgi:hypothetical protein